MHSSICQASAQAIAAPGDWLDGQQRIDIWRQVRDSSTNPLDTERRLALSPAAIEGTHPATEHLSSVMNDSVHRIASDPGRLTRAWADSVIAEIGEEIYTEIVGVIALATSIDWFHRSMGLDLVELPDPASGSPALRRPDGVGDIGAWVSQSVEKARANVSRALSLVPITNDSWRVLVDGFYSRGDEFFDLSWDRPLSRPQVELVAARTTVLNECFY